MLENRFDDAKLCGWVVCRLLGRRRQQTADERQSTDNCIDGYDAGNDQDPKLSAK